MQPSEKLAKLNKRNRILFLEDSFYYKLMFPGTERNVARESVASRDLCNNPFWLEFYPVVNDFSFFYRGVSVGISPFREGVSLLEDPSAIKHVADRMHCACVSLGQFYESKDWFYFFDCAMLLYLKQNDRKLFHFVFRSLENLTFPMTAGHGDLSPGNVVVDRHRIQTVDWEMYQPEGSYIVDLCWLSGCQARDTVHPKKDVLDVLNSSLNWMSSFALSSLQVALLYALHKFYIDCELHHNGIASSYGALRCRLKALLSLS